MEVQERFRSMLEILQGSSSFDISCGRPWIRSWVALGAIDRRGRLTLTVPADRSSRQVRHNDCLHLPTGCVAGFSSSEFLCRHAKNRTGEHQWSNDHWLWNRCHRRASRNRWAVHASALEIKRKRDWGGPENRRSLPDVIDCRRTESTAGRGASRRVRRLQTKSTLAT